MYWGLVKFLVSAFIKNAFGYENIETFIKPANYTLCMFTLTRMYLVNFSGSSITMCNRQGAFCGVRSTILQTGIPGAFHKNLRLHDETWEWILLPLKATASLLWLSCLILSWLAFWRSEYLFILIRGRVCNVFIACNFLACNILHTHWMV